MGYTHYFHTKDAQDNVRSLDQTLWEQTYVPLVRQIFRIVQARGISLADGEGAAKSKPIVDHAAVNFNGKEPEHYETLFLPQSGTEFSFCKTNRRPYDEAVVAVLLAAQQVFGEAFHFGSDGGEDDLAEGRRLLDMATASAARAVKRQAARDAKLKAE
jgi:hypothetical protein